LFSLAEYTIASTVTTKTFQLPVDADNVDVELWQVASSIQRTF
jgi:hypothetical protein